MHLFICDSMHMKPSSQNLHVYLMELCNFSKHKTFSHSTASNIRYFHIQQIAKIFIFIFSFPIGNKMTKKSDLLLLRLVPSIDLLFEFECLAKHDGWNNEKWVKDQNGIVSHKTLPPCQESCWACMREMTIRFTTRDLK